MWAPSLCQTLAQPCHWNNACHKKLGLPVPPQIEAIPGLLIFIFGVFFFWKFPEDLSKSLGLLSDVDSSRSILVGKPANRLQQFLSKSKSLGITPAKSTPTPTPPAQLWKISGLNLEVRWAPLNSGSYSWVAIQRVGLLLSWQCNPKYVY